MTEPATVPAPMTESWFSTADHKRLGLLYLGAALLFLVVGGALGVVVGGSQSDIVDVTGDDFVRIFSMHATVTSLLVLAPLWVGLATYVVPLQLGASRLALPRMHAFSFWLYLVGGVIVVAAYLQSDPVDADLWATGLMCVAVATVLAAVDLAVTVATMRTAGMTVGRVPFFSLATFATSVATVLATPVFLAGLVLLYFHNHYGGSFFAADNAATRVLGLHMLSLFGRPEALLLVVPGLGAACDIVATHARRPLFLHQAARAAIPLAAGLTFLVWAGGSHIAGAVTLPMPTAASALIVAPVGVVVLLWLASMAFGAPTFHVSLAFVAGFLGLAAFGAINAVVAAFADVEGGTAWTSAHMHVVAFGAPLMLALAALYHWAPKMWGRPLSAGLGGLVFLALFGGFFLNGLGSYLLGYDDVPAGLEDFEETAEQGYAVLAAAGGAVIALGVLLLVADVLRVASASRRSEAGDADPYEGLTLEWAAASPPPPANFDAVPEVRSAEPLHDLRVGAASGGSD